GAAGSASRLSAASSGSTAGPSKWATTRRGDRGSSSSCRADAGRGERARMKERILIVDDEAGVRSALSGVLRDEGYTVEAVDSGEACLDRAIRSAYDAIVLDIWLPGMDGLATLQKLQERRVDTPGVMISGH